MMRTRAAGMRAASTTPWSTKGRDGWSTSDEVVIVIDVLLRALIVGGSAYVGARLGRQTPQRGGWFADPWGQARLR